MTRAQPTGDAGLVVMVPEAERLVGKLREQHDPSALEGVGAHVTVLYPFLPAARIDGAALATVLDVVGDHERFTVTFGSAGFFPGNVVWLRPEPDGPLRALTSGLAEAFSSCPPYGGEFPDPVPHLTVAVDLDDQEAARLVRSLSLSLVRSPVTTTVAELVLIARDATGRWRRRAAIPLGTAPESEDR